MSRGGRMNKKRKWSKRNLNEQDFRKFIGVLAEEKITIEWASDKEKLRFIYDPQGSCAVGYVWWYELSYASVRMRLDMSRSQWDRFMYYLWDEGLSKSSHGNVSGGIE